jgi:tetratricopeptide (TPR) repeat protein
MQEQAIGKDEEATSEKSVADPVRSDDSPSRLGRIVRWFCGVIVLAIIAVAVAWGVVQWVERPLAEAEQAWAAGDYEQAAGLAGYFLDTHPNHTRAMVIKARALSRLGRAQEAAELFRRAGVEDVRDIHLLAESLLTLGQFMDALPLLTHVLDSEPHNADALYEITTCRMRLHLYNDALITAATFAEQPGCEPRGRLLLATIYHDLHNHEQAIQQCKRLLELEPDGENLQLPRHEVFILYGRTLLEAGKAKDALPILGRSILLAATAEAYALIGDAAAQVGEPSRAESLWQSALKLDSNYIPAREALANLAVTNRDGKKALEWLKPIESHPHLQASTAYLFQRAYVLMQDEAAAKAWQAKTAALRKHERLTGTLDRVVSESPNSYWSWIIQAYRFAETGNWEQAAAILQMVSKDKTQDNFVRDLEAAVRSRGTLPPLDRIPLKDF